MVCNIKRTTFSLAIAGAILTAGFSTGAIADGKNASKYRSHTYKITVKNLTYGQIFSPPIAAAHSYKVRAFSAGQPASAGLEVLAEDGVPSDLAAELEAEGANVAVNGGDTPAPVLPGESATFYLTASKKNPFVSVLGMLVTTNDAFFGLSAVYPKGHRSTHRVPAYDAGTEVNDENCNHIPGPPCGNGGQSITPGENGPDEDGVVHIHRGMHSLSDGVDAIDAARDDWRNPVAEITIVPVRRKK